MAGGRMVPVGGGIGIGMLLLVLVLSAVFGQDPTKLLTELGGGQVEEQAPAEAPQGGTVVYDEEKDRIAAVLGDIEDTWGPIFTRAGAEYATPKLVLYSSMTRTACGMGQAATGPFYCPGDGKVYIDLAFFQELGRLGIEGEFAQAYVVAHEVGHHVQNEMGITTQVRRIQEQARSQAEVNEVSVLLELQADCYAGIWAHFAETQRDLLDAADVEEGINAAAAVGDDRLQRMSGRAVNPDSFTHGTSAERAGWFLVGFKAGDLQTCDVFAKGADGYQR